MQIIGVIWGGDMSDVWRFRDAFRQKLHDLGKVEGQNITIAERYIKASDASVDKLAGELAAIPVNVIVPVGTPAAQAARTATAGKDISVVFAAVGDQNLVAAANVTGIRLLEPASSGERLRFLKEAIPSVKRVAVLRNDNPVHDRYLAEITAVANNLDIDLQTLFVLDTLAADALIVLPDPRFASQRAKIMSFALEKKLPAIYSFSRYVEEGGLMSYGPSYIDMFRQAAVLVNDILNKPSELPRIEEVRCSELVINLNTARRIGYTISDSVLARAIVIH